MNDALCAAIRAFTDGHPGTNGVFATPHAGLHLIRADRTSALEHQFYEPALIAVVQGAKETVLADRRFAYHAGDFLILSVGLPVQARITEATRERPYLAVALTIDFGLVDELVRAIDAPPVAAEPNLGLFLGTLDARQRDAIARLAGVIGDAGALRVLSPSIAREIFYWTLVGRNGAELRRLATPDAHTRRIADAIRAMRATYTETLSVEGLAAIAHMSPSSFHYHFKRVTAMSPLQYQKHLRLIEARRLMLATGADAARAAYDVGYESPSHFSREYARMFGAPPRRDIDAARAAIS